MSEPLSTKPTILVVLGATGDLMARKITPSLFYLQGKGLLPEQLWVVGFGRRPWGDAELRSHIGGILAEKYPDADAEQSAAFLDYFRYFHGNFDQPEAFLGLGSYLKSHRPGVGSVLEQALLPRRSPRALSRDPREHRGRRTRRAVQRRAGLDADPDREAVRR